MKVTIEVKDRAEANAVLAAMSDPVTRALTIVNGLLIALPDNRARARVLAWLADWSTDPRRAEPLQTTMFGDPALRLHDGAAGNGTSGE